MKNISFKLLSILIVASMLLAAFGVMPVAAKDPELALEPATATPVSQGGDQKGSTEKAVYIIRLEGASLTSYRGEIGSLAATSPRVTGAIKLDATSPASQAYSDYLAQERAGVISAMEQSLGRQVEIPYQYYVTFNGMAARLSAGEAAQVATLPGVADVHPEVIRYPTTDYGPAWIGAEGIWEGTTTGSLDGTMGEGVIVGIIDTGLNLDHPSFAEVGPSDGYTHVNPLGEDTYLGLCASDPTEYVCNDKLIGYYIYTGESGDDSNGHGSHTGSTVAGNVLGEGTVDLSAYDYSPAISGVAPHATIIGYDVCENGCPESASIAATEQAVLDGVDVINFSIGGGTTNPWGDGGSLAFLAAADAGVVPVTSAGNDGPGAGTIGSPADAPWMLSVGASTHNRAGSNALINMTGGDTTPPADIQGKGLSNGHGPAAIVYAAGYINDDGEPDDGRCLTTFPEGTWTAGEIVVCDRGVIARVAKGYNVLQGGAGGYILANADPGESLSGDVHHLPAVQITYDDGVALKAWLASGSNHVATIEGTTISVDPANADIMAGFSSRGPNVNNVPSIIKPDVTAPGVDILAAYRTGVVDADSPTTEYALVSGTSMASPHTAGAAALMKALYPSWTVAEIKSALMTTATTAGVLKEDGVTPADPFDIGGGRVDLSMAGHAGLVLDVTTEEFEAADPDLGGDPKTLNLASLGNSACVNTCTWERTVKSVVASPQDWTVSVASVPGLTLEVSPTAFSLNKGITQTIVITADVTGAPVGEWFFGELTLLPAGRAPAPPPPPAHMPVAVSPSYGVLPDVIEIQTRRNAGSQLQTGLEAIEITDLTITSHGLVQADQHNFELYEDPTNTIPEGFYDDLSQVFWMTMPVPADTHSLIAEILASESPDLDMAVGYDTDGDGEPELAEQVCQSAGPSWTEFCEVVAPTAGTWWVVVLNWQESSSAPDAITLATALVPEADSGNMTVTGPASVPELELFDISVYWDTPEMVAGDRWYGAFDIGTDPGNPGNVGTIPVHIVRHEDDVVKTVSPSSILVPGTYTLNYTITVQPNITPLELGYFLTDTIPAGMTYVPGSAWASEGEVNVVGDELTWSGVMPVFGYTYDIATSDTEPSCVAPLATDGAYVDLESYGLTADPGVSGDGIWFSVDFSGGEYDFFGEYQGESWNFTDDGFTFFDPSTPGLTPSIHEPIPTADEPNNLQAVLWRDLEVVYDAGTNKGVTLANLTSDGIPSAGLIEFDDVEPCPAGSTTDHFDFEVVAYYDADPGRYEYIFAYDNLVGDVTAGTIGLEDLAGTFGVQYAFDDIAVVDGMAICFDRVVAPSDPVTITYETTVTIEETDDIVAFTNNVEHQTDNPGSMVTTTSVDVNVVSCVEDVALSVLTADPIYTGDEVEFSADITPDNFASPYNYTIDFGDLTPPEADSDSADPFTASHAYTTPGTYNVEIQVWNCDVGDAVADTVEVVVMEAPTDEYYIYLPLVSR